MLIQGTKPMERRRLRYKSTSPKWNKTRKLLALARKGTLIQVKYNGQRRGGEKFGGRRELTWHPPGGIADNEIIG